MGLAEAEDINFKYTETSLNRVYQISFKHALEMIQKNGGKVSANAVEIPVQKPVAVRYEKSFEGVYPIKKVGVNRQLKDKYDFEFEGTGFVLVGVARKPSKEATDLDIPLEVYVDGKKIASTIMPTNYLKRKDEVFWIYDLPKGKHKASIVKKDTPEGYYVDLTYNLIYSDEPNVGIENHVH